MNRQIRKLSSRTLEFCDSLDELSSRKESDNSIYRPLVQAMSEDIPTPNISTSSKIVVKKVSSKLFNTTKAHLRWKCFQDSAILWQQMYQLDWSVMMWFLTSRLRWRGLKNGLFIVVIVIRVLVRWKLIWIPRKKWIFIALLAELRVHEISGIQSLSMKFVEISAVCPRN